MAKYVQVLDFVSNLTEKYEDTDIDLPVYPEHVAMLKQRLGSDGYTYLQLRDGYNTEVIKVAIVSGNLIVTRGVELTKAKVFPKGSLINWVMTSSAVRDIVCQMPCCP
jgi:hypothetical protein